MGMSTDICSYCGINYRDFRTGFTYSDIYQLLWVDSEDASLWRYKRRHTVLGFWHALKLDAWNDHLSACQAGAAIAPAGLAAPLPY